MTSRSEDFTITTIAVSRILIMRFGGRCGGSFGGLRTRISIVGVIFVFGKIFIGGGFGRINNCLSMLVMTNGGTSWWRNFTFLYGIGRGFL